MFWGIDLGGTKIEAVALEALDPSAIRSRRRVPTDAHKGYEHILSQISSVVDAVAAEVGGRPAAIGVGHPGTLDHSTMTVKNSNSQSLNGRALAADLTSKLGIPVVLANDANCFALAEATLGAGRGFPTMFGIIMGTGVGGGIVVHSSLLNGAQGIAGEWGHNSLDAAGPDCYCGKRGCVESMLSGPAIERFYKTVSGYSKSLVEIVVDAEVKADAHALLTLQHLTSTFGRAVSQVINILDPHCIVLGGGLSNIDALYTAGVTAAADHVFNNRLETKFKRNVLGDSAGVFGAALLGSKGQHL